MRDLEHLIPPEQQQRSPEYMPQPEEFMQCAEYTEPPTEYNEFPEGHWEEVVQDKAASDSKNESESGAGSGERSRNKNQRDGKRGRADRAEKAKKQARVQQKSKSFMSRAGSRIGSAFPMVGMTVGIAMTVVVASVASDGAFLPGVAETAVAVADKLNTPMVVRQEGLAVEEVVAAFSEDADKKAKEEDTVEKLAKADSEEKKDADKQTTRADTDKVKKATNDKSSENRGENRPNVPISGMIPGVAASSGGGSAGGVGRPAGNGNVSDGNGSDENGSTDSGNGGAPETPETPLVPVVPHTHEYTWEVVTAAACTTSGVQRGTCSCGEIIEESIPATGHTLEIMEAVAPTCEWTGLTEGEKCAVCGEILKEQETIAMLPHTEEVIPGKAATCTAAGLTDGKKCAACGEILKEQETIAMLPHTEVEIPRIEPTCTVEGSTAGVKCSVCQVILTQPTPIAAKGHEVANWEIGTTKEHNGACSSCQQVFKEAHVDADSNNYCEECGRAIAELDMIFAYMGSNRFNLIVKFPQGKSLLNGCAVNVEVLEPANTWNPKPGSPSTNSYIVNNDAIGSFFESLDPSIPEGEAIIKITANSAAGKMIYQSTWKLTIGNTAALVVNTPLTDTGENTLVEIEPL